MTTSVECASKRRRIRNASSPPTLVLLLLSSTASAFQAPMPIHVGLLHRHVAVSHHLRPATTTRLAYYLSSPSRPKGRWELAPSAMRSQATDATATDEDQQEQDGLIVESDINDASSSSYPPVPSLRECLGFMLPALGIYAAPPLLSLIDAAFVGRTSSVELAALGPASSISDSATLPLLFLSIAATNLIAKSTSKGNADEGRRVTRACLGLGTVGGIAIALAVFFKRLWLSSVYCGEPLTGGAAAAVLTPHCSSYTAIRTLGLPAVVVASIAQAVCIGIKDTRTPMVAVLLAAALNLVGDFVMVSRLGLGIAGAAWATSLSQLCAAGLLLRVLAKRGFLRGRGVSQETFAPVQCNVAATAEGGEAEVYCESSTWETISSILSFIPFLFVMAVKIGMHNSAAATAASLGGAPAAAHTALFAVAMLCFTFGDTSSSLSQAFLPAFASNDCEIDPENPGSPKGRRRSQVSFDIAAAKPTMARLLKCTFGVSATVIAISSALLTIFASQITNDPAVLRQMRRALPFMVGTLSLHGTAVTLEGLLLAQQNFRGLTATYGVLAITIAAALGYVRASGVGLLGVWATYIWFQLFRVVTFSAFGGLLLPKRGLVAGFGLWKQVFGRKPDFTSDEEPL